MGEAVAAGSPTTKRRAVVTGGTRGLGFGLAAALGRHGAAVTICGSSAADTVRAVDALRRRVPDGAFHGVACDVRDPAQVEALAMAGAAAMGGIDLWVNNAGLARTGATLDELAPADLDTMIDVNLRGVIHGCRVAARAMRASGGTIVNVHGAGSDGKPVPGMIGYATTKRAVQFFTAALAEELTGGLVTAIGISPGLVLTEGFFREHARIASERRRAREAVVNILADDVDTVADWATRIMLGSPVGGREYRWLSPAKIRRRAQAVPPRNVLARHRGPTGVLPGGSS